MEPMMIELSGAQGSGKTTLSRALCQQLLSLGAFPTLFDDGQRQSITVVPRKRGMYSYINPSRVKAKYFGSATEVKSLKKLLGKTLAEDFEAEVDAIHQVVPEGLKGARVIIKVQEAM